MGREARLRDKARLEGRLMAHSIRLEMRINVVQEAQAAPAPGGGAIRGQMRTTLQFESRRVMARAGRGRSAKRAMVAMSFPFRKRKLLLRLGGGGLPGRRRLTAAHRGLARVGGRQPIDRDRP